MADYNVGAVKGSVELNTKQIQDAVKKINALGKAFESINKSSKAASKAASSASELANSSSKAKKSVADLEAEMLKLDKKAQAASKALAASKGSADAVAAANKKLATAYRNAQNAIKSSGGDVKTVRTALQQYERTLVDTREALMANERATKANNESIRKQEALVRKLEAAQRKAEAVQKKAEAAQRRATSEAKKEAAARALSIRQQNLHEEALARANRNLERMVNLERSVTDVTGASGTAIAKAKASIMAYEKAVQRYGRSSLQAGRASRQMTADINAANAASTRLAGGLNATRGAFRTIRGAAGQFGHQLQDIAVQGQMGTNWLIILAQQGSQILSLIGGWGPLAGAALAIGAALFHAFDGMSWFKSEADKADEKLKELKKSLDDVRKQLAEEKVEANSIISLEASIQQAEELSRMLEVVEVGVSRARKTFSAPSGARMERWVSGFAPENVEMINKTIEGLNKIYGTELKTITATSSREDAEAALLSLKQQLLTATEEERKLLDHLRKDELDRVADFEKQITDQQRLNALIRDASTYEEARNRLAEEKKRIKYEEDGFADSDIDRMLKVLQVEKDLLDTLKEQAKKKEDIEKFQSELSAQVKRNQLLSESVDYEEAQKTIAEENLRTKYESLGLSEAEIQNMVEAVAKEKEMLETLKQQSKERLTQEKTLNKIKKQFEDNSSEFDKLVKSSEEFSKILKGSTGDFALFEISDKQMNEVLAQFKALDKAVVAGVENGGLTQSAAEQMKKGIIEGVKEGADSTDLARGLDKLGLVAVEVITEGLVNNDWSNIGQDIGASLGSALGSTFGPYGAAAGQIIGEAAGKAIDDWFNAPSYDPTADRQASTGTGTVLGSIDKKSDSIKNAVEESENSLSQIVGINSQMLNTMTDLNNSIGALNTRIAIDFGDMDGLSAPQARSASELTGSVGRGAVGLATNGMSELLNFIPGIDMGKVGEDASKAYLDYLSVYFTAGIVDFNDILGGDVKLKDEGIRIVGGVLDEMVNGTVAQAFIDYEEKKNFLDDWDSRTKTSELDAATNNALQDVFLGIKDATINAAALLGTDVSDDIGQMIIDPYKISLEDLNAEESAAALTAYFSQQFDLMAEEAIPFFKEFIQAGESAGDVLTRLATSSQLVTEALSLLDVTMTSLGGKAGIEANEYLVGLFGGNEAFQQSVSSFFDTFASEADKFDFYQSSITTALAAHNMQLPETAEQYYALRKELELSGKEGADAFKTLVSLGPTVSQYFKMKEGLEENAAEAEIKAIQEVEDAFLAMLNAIQKRLEEAQKATDAAYAALVGQVDIQKDLLKDQLDAQLDAIKAETDAKLAANKLQIESAKELVKGVESEMKAVEAAIATLIPEYEPNQSQRRTDAVQTLIRALQTGDLTGTGDAAKLAAQIEADNYKTRSSFEYEQARTLNILDGVDKKAKDQLSEAEMQLEALENLKDTIKAQGEAAEQAAKNAYDKQVDQLDAMLQYELDQINELRGIHETINSIADALLALDLAQSNELGQQSQVEAAVKAIYQEELGRAADIEGLNWFVNQVTQGLKTLSDVRADLAYAASQDAQTPNYGPVVDPNTGFEYYVPDPNAWNIPQFAKGGVHSGGLAMVGENGPEIINTAGAARIHNNSQTQQMLGNAANDELLEAMVEELTELRYLVATDVKYNRRASEILDQYRSNGFTADEDVA